MTSVRIHPSLKRFTDDKSDIIIKSKTAGELIPELCLAFPKLKSTILDNQGKLTPYVNVYINGTSLKELNQTLEISTTDNIEVVTALVGG